MNELHRQLIIKVGSRHSTCAPPGYGHSKRREAIKRDHGRLETVGQTPKNDKPPANVGHEDCHNGEVELTLLHWMTPVSVRQIISAHTYIKPRVHLRRQIMTISREEVEDISDSASYEIDRNSKDRLQHLNMVIVSRPLGVIDNPLLTIGLDNEKSL